MAGGARLLQEVQPLIPYLFLADVVVFHLYRLWTGRRGR